MGVTALPASAATITVTSPLGDSSPGTLHAALIAANSTPDPDVIDLTGLSGTIAITQALPAIEYPVTFLGPGSEVLAVDLDNHPGLSATNTLLLPGFDVTVSGLTLTGAQGEGIGARDVNLRLDDVVVDGSSADNLKVEVADGFEAVITDSAFTNSSGDDGIDLTGFGGSFTLSNISATGNQLDGLNATVTLGGTLTLSGTNDVSANGQNGVTLTAEDAAVAEISGTTANETGNQGFYLSAADASTIDVRDSSTSGAATYGIETLATYDSRISFARVTASDADDTGFSLRAYSGSTIDVSRAVASGNARNGFAIEGTEGTITMDEVVSVDNDQAGVYAWGIPGDFGEVTDAALIRSSVLIERSLVAHNDGSGIDIYWMMATDFAVENVTVTGNTSTEESENCVAGALIVGDAESRISVLHSTIVNNISAHGCPQLGIGGSARVAHSIVTGTEWDIAAAFDADYTVEWNILGTIEEPYAPVSGFAVPGTLEAAANFDDALADPTNLIGVDPMLGALADNGGFSQTMLPASGSPAIDGGNPDIADAPETDQRGAQRVLGDAIDVGAVEVGVGGVAPEEEDEDVLPDTGSSADAGLVTATILLLLGTGLIMIRTVRRRTV